MTGLSPSTPLKTLHAARDAARKTRCRQQTVPCHATIKVAGGQYNLVTTLVLDERDSNTRWEATSFARIGGGVAIGSNTLEWEEYRQPHSEPDSAASRQRIYVANVSEYLPTAVKENILKRNPRRQTKSKSKSKSRSTASTSTSRKWNYGRAPGLVNQLFVDERRAVRARYPSADPETDGGLCFSTPAAAVAGKRGCAKWLTPDGGIAKKQPQGTVINGSLMNNYPTCMWNNCVNRGLSPTKGCAECHMCGTFGPYHVEQPPPGHPVYDGTTPLVHSWTNGSVASFWSSLFDRPAGFRSESIANRSRQRHWKHPDTGIVHMYHGALWGWWSFNIAELLNNGSITFGYGGYQEARGWSVTAQSRFYVENVLEELDTPGEFYFDAEMMAVYYMPQVGVDINAVDIVLPILNTLVSIKGRTQDAATAAAPTPTPATTSTAGVGDGAAAGLGGAGASAGAATTTAPILVKNVTFEGFYFTQTRSTFLSEPYQVPSGGDWSVAKAAAVQVEDAEGISFQNNVFNQTGGNAVLFAAHVATSSVLDCTFERIGDSAIVFLGAAAVDDGTAPTYPTNNVVERNYVHNYGVYGKQVSAFFQALSANTTLRDNVFHNGPRAHINFNDGFGGNNVVEGNLLFNAVQETADHGPFNSWDRMPYWTLNGVDDGFDGSREGWNVTKPKKGASAVKAQDYIRGNFVFTDHGGTRALDHDDGSQFFTDEGNVLVYSGVKNFLGNSKTFVGNLIVNAGSGTNIGCFANDGSAATGRSNHVFANNSCSYVQATPYPMHPYNASEGPPGSGAFREFVDSSTFSTAGNTYFTAGSKYLMMVPSTSQGTLPTNLSLAEVASDSAAEHGSTEHPMLTVHETVQRARELLLPAAA